MIYLDLDGFKALNDAYGHPTGDSLLNLIATRLAHALRAEDLVSRLGGDEYACLIAGVTSPERLQNIASSLFGAVAAPFKIGSLCSTYARALASRCVPWMGQRPMPS